MTRRRVGRGGRAGCLLAGEDVAVPPGFGVLVEVVLEVGDQAGGEGDGALAGGGLGWADEVLAMAVELALLDDGQFTGVEVEVAAAEAEQLALAEPDEAGEQDDAAVAGVDRLGDGVDLGDRGDRSFLGGLDAGPFDVARVGGEQAVLGGRHHDRAEQSVALGCRAGAGAVEAALLR